MKVSVFTLLALLFFTVALHGQDKRVRVAFFGSSVCFGTGADKNQGYAWQFYHRNGGIDTTKFAYVNVSVGGDNTLKVEQEQRLAKRLLPTRPDIVVIGLSLANEGIMASSEDDRERVFEQFRSRLLSLADSLSTLGMKVVIANCYAQSSFAPVHYGYTRKMNQIINTWNYPSINLMGSVDNGRGHWVEGFVADPLHPNSAGHHEMSLTIVPTLFEAISEGKRVPKYDWSANYCRVDNPTKAEILVHDVKSAMHSFAVAFRFKRAANGTILKIVSDSGVRSVVARSGEISYKGHNKQLVTDTASWNHIVISHNYARQQTTFAVNGEVVGTVAERVSPTRFVVGGDLEAIDIKDVTLHRSSLNDSEIREISNKQFVQSSLEIYSPLTLPVAGASVVNIAQSKSVLSTSGIVKYEFVSKKLY